MSFWKRKIAEVLAVVSVAGIFLWWNPVSILTPVRGAVWVALEPMALFVTHIGNSVGDFFGSLVHIATLKGENSRLSERVADLEGQVADLSDMRSENDQLRAEMGASARGENVVSYALVIGYDLRGMGDTMTVDKGSEDGIVSGMTVVHGQNILVGTVETVLPDVSTVRVISNPDSVFNVRTVGTQAKGVVRGKFGLGVLLDSVLQTDVLREGDGVVTSQLGTQYPPGLYVGTIGEIGVSSDGLFQQATVLPPVDFSSIHTVSVIRE